MPISADVVESLRAKFDAILPHLDERSTRLLLAAEARSLGHGGIAAVARASGAARSRVQQGVAELEAGALEEVAPLLAEFGTETNRTPAQVMTMIASDHKFKRLIAEFADTLTLVDVLRSSTAGLANGEPVDEDTRDLARQMCVEVNVLIGESVESLRSRLVTLGEVA